jgi:predicted porin
MKKTLIALAAVAVTGAASAQVTISGTLTFDAKQSTKITTLSAADVTSSITTDQTGQADVATTSQIAISGKEDLGGGMTGAFQANTGMNGAGFGARDLNVSLSGDFGAVRLGRFVPAAAYGWYGFSGNGTTGAGSVYHAGMDGLTYGQWFGAATTALNAAGSYERNNNQLQYTSPSINGLTFNVNYGTTSDDSTLLNGKATTTQQGFSAAYAAGPLSLGMGKNSRTVDAEGTTTTATGTKIDGDLDWYGASYDLGVAKLTFANMQRKDQSALLATGVVSVASDMEINSFGVSVPMGAVTLSVSAYSGKNDGSSATTDNYDLSGNQVYVNYALGKLTSIYAMHGTTKASRASGNTTSVGTTRSRTAVGILKSF